MILLTSTRSSKASRPSTEMFPRGGLQNAHQQPEERGFPGAVRTEQPADLSGRNRKGDVIQGHFVAKGLADAVDANEIRVASHPPDMFAWRVDRHQAPGSMPV